MTRVEQSGDEITIEVVSPTHFNTAAHQWSEAGAKIAEEMIDN